jgi:hypothetical protein
MHSSIQGTVADRHPEHTTGMAGSISSCIITYRMVAPCDRCGRPASPVHMPRREHGLYCAECCPACSQRTMNAEVGG